MYLPREFHEDTTLRRLGGERFEVSIDEHNKRDYTLLQGRYGTDKSFRELAIFCLTLAP